MTGSNEILQLGWGNPTFLEPYWSKIDLSIPANLPIAYHSETLPELEKSIKDIHKMVGNANTKDKHLVIGAGASNLLTAIFHVLHKPVYAEPPYFLRFPAIAEIAHVPFKKCNKGYEIITTPNNPTGTLSDKTPQLAIYDLCYNWPQYTPTVINHNQDIMVFSLAKATGHASTRLGWAWFKNENTARRVKQYIEHSSCGVSIEAQTKGIKILQHLLTHPTDTCFTEGRKILLERHNKLNKLKLPFKKLSHNGMFLWLEIGDPETFFCDKLIGFIYGEACGSYYNTARINLGCTEKEFKEFVKRILAK